jgi:hypothetical protein
VRRVVEIGDHREDRRRFLGGGAHGVGLLDDVTGGGGHPVQVPVADGGSVDPAAPDARLARTERVLLPAVERACHRDAASVRGPHRESAAALARLRAELTVEITMGALVEEIAVEFVGHSLVLPRMDRR